MEVSTLWQKFTAAGLTGDPIYLDTVDKVQFLTDYGWENCRRLSEFLKSIQCQLRDTKVGDRLKLDVCGDLEFVRVSDEEADFDTKVFVPLRKPNGVIGGWYPEHWCTIVSPAE